MSTSSPPLRRVGIDTVQSSARSLARATGFWSAVALPFVLLVVLANGGAQRHPGLFAGLLVANLVALVLGQNYER